jgi:hypothetical protein
MPHAGDLVHSAVELLYSKCSDKKSLNMADAFPLGQFAGLKLSARPSAIPGSLLLWALFSVLGWVLFSSPASAFTFGLLCAILHWLSELVHNLGHAWAARRSGYPMSGVRLWFIFAQSLYPAEEPALPGHIHIRRALGGPAASLLLGCLAGALALLAAPAGGFAWWVLTIITLDNWLVLGLGALLPLGFTDGSTLLTWWGK